MSNFLTELAKLAAGQGLMGLVLLSLLAIMGGMGWFFVNMQRNIATRDKNLNEREAMHTASIERTLDRYYAEVKSYRQKVEDANQRISVLEARASRVPILEREVTELQAHLAILRAKLRLYEESG